ncbi:MAG: protein kinase [Solobacterium sp.]|nr:protein kinase [Solobacterium sp.]
MDKHTDPVHDELYQTPGNRQSILIDPDTRRIILQKKLDYYDLRVFQYLKDHHCEYIPEILDFYESGGQLVVREEYIQGKTLAETLEEKDLNRKEKKAIVLSVMDGMVFLHHADPPIIHRDLKASNILIAYDGSVKIIDYDAAKIYKPDAKRDTVLIGTEGSAAPEQYGFGASDTRTDIYALGVLIRELFPGDRKLLAIADKAAMLDPSDRYQTVEALRRDFAAEQIAAYRKYLPPGFRTGRWWKMCIAVFAYLLILYLGLKMEITDSVTGEAVRGSALIKYRVITVIILLCEIDLFTGWTHIYDRFPFIRSKNILLRIIGHALAASLIVVFFTMILLLIL